MDIYQALKNDHDALKPLLAQLVESTQNNDDTKALLDQIRDLLVPHARAEEAILYNSLRALDASKDVVAHAYAEHTKAETTLHALRGMAAINIEWTTAAKKLQEDLEHHIAEEESRVFDAARQVLLEGEAEQMAEAFEHMKPEIKEQGMMKNTAELIANMMPKRFSEYIEGSHHT